MGSRFDYFVWEQESKSKFLTDDPKWLKTSLDMWMDEATRRKITQEKLEKLVKEAIELFNDGLNIGLGWVARAERLIDGDV